MHILIGEKEIVEQTQCIAAQRGSISWIVPKGANSGDTVVLFFPHVGFLARGVVMSKPEPGTFGRRSCYRADVGQIAFFAYPVELDEIARRFPDWGWPKYPRSFTTPPLELAEQLSECLTCLSTEADLGKKSPSDAN